jgi:hypothetical protein
MNTYEAPPMKNSTLPQSPCTFIPILPEPQNTLLAKEMPYGEIISDDERKPVYQIVTAASANELSY